MFQIKIYQEIKECEKIWRYFSPNISLFDDWDFRYLFHKASDTEAELLVGLLDDQPIGLLPLQKNKDDTAAREFFGGNWMEDNRIFFKPDQANLFKQYTAAFYNNIPKPFHLVNIIQDNELLEDPKVQSQDNEYTLKLDGLTNYDDYLEQYWEGKSKRKIRKFTNNILTNDPIVKIGKEEDLERLFDLNIQRFAEESSYQSENRKKIFHQLFTTELQIDILKIQIADEISAVSFSILYNHMYYCLSSGIDLKIENLSKYFNLIKIQRAIDLKAQAINFLTGDYGYKHRWFPHLIPAYSYNYE